MIECIRRFNDLHGRPPKVADWNPTAARSRRGGGRPATAERAGEWPHANTVSRIFGSWNAAIRAAGLPETPPGGLPSWTEDLVLERMRRFAELYGEPPRVTDWNPTAAVRRGRPELAERFERDGCWPHANTVQRLFGSWTGALRRAGFGKHLPGTAKARTAWIAQGLVSSTDIADMVGIDRFAVRRPLARSGLLPVAAHGRVPLYRRDDAERFAEQLRSAITARSEALAARRGLSER